MKRPLTNFRAGQLPIYEKAVATSPQVGFSIQSNPIPGNPSAVKTDCSLWYDGEEDCGPFWRNFDKIEAEMEVQ